ncbi:chromate resistance protein ChrB domain-containing protein [Streptomyces sp. NPDC088801]|uniref:chromate resistance protein ChrB domain-containing protein n=1 Tax=Streptomyces sp. NPDC088801 TaxID=3365903 RepID=UPI003824F8D0
MRWATLAHVHLDRVASPWLVRRFVDPAAEFEFVEWGLDGGLPDPARLRVPEGATPIGIPGVRLGLHDEHGSCFQKVLRAYELDDPALWRMERVIAAGISHALGTPERPDQTEEERVLGTTLDLLGTALGVAFDDAEHLENAMPLYDGVYEHCRMRELSKDIVAGAPKHPPLRNPYYREALRRAQSPSTRPPHHDGRAGRGVAR